MSSHVLSEEVLSQLTALSLGDLSRAVKGINCEDNVRVQAGDGLGWIAGASDDGGDPGGEIAWGQVTVVVVVAGAIRGTLDGVEMTAVVEVVEGTGNKASCGVASSCTVDCRGD